MDIGYLDSVAPALHGALDRLRAAADGRDTTTGALALAWLMARPDVASITTAPSRRPPHLALVRAALDCAVSSKEAAEWSSWFVDAASDMSSD